MNKVVIFCISVLLLIILAAGCSESPAPDMEEPGDVNSGRADFSTLVAIGNSLTAGVRASYLSGEYQLNSYPALIAGQMGKTVGRDSGDDFLLPFASPGYGFLQNFTGYNHFGLPVITQVPLFGTVSNRNINRPYNNLGVPGATTADIINATTTANAYGNNPFFDLLLRNAGSSTPIFDPPQTVLQQAASLQPTFAFLWIGNNDVLGAATSGNTNPDRPTPVAAFEADLRKIFDELKQANSNIKGVIANIPDVSSIPFVTTVPVEVSLPGGGTQRLYITRGDGSSGLASFADQILLDAIPVIGDSSGLNGPAGLPAGLHPSAPLADDLVLDSLELQIIAAAVSGYNAVIASLAQQHDFALVDANAILETIASSGIEIDGVLYSADLIDGGVFSIDGVHPKAAGYGIVANTVIDAINAAYGSEIPTIKIDEVQ